jgi:hypothetical protein
LHLLAVDIAAAVSSLTESDSSLAGELDDIG